MKRFYVCGVAFQHEIGECDDVRYYSTLEDIKEKSKCWEECGIVEIWVDGVDHPKLVDEIQTYEWIVEQNLYGDKNE